MATPVSDAVRCTHHQLKEERYTEEIAELANSLSDLSVYDLGTRLEHGLRASLLTAQRHRRVNRNRTITCLRCAAAQHKAQA